MKSVAFCVTGALGSLGRRFDPFALTQLNPSHKSESSNSLCCLLEVSIMQMAMIFIPMYDFDLLKWKYSELITVHLFIVYLKLISKNVHSQQSITSNSLTIRGFFNAFIIFLCQKKN